MWQDVDDWGDGQCLESLLVRFGSFRHLAHRSKHATYTVASSVFSGNLELPLLINVDQRSR